MICIAKTDPKPDCLFAYTGHPFDKEVGLQSSELRHYVGSGDTNRLWLLT